MKKTVSLITGILLILGIITACGGGKKGKASIYGTWKITGRSQYVFNKDGSFIHKDTMDDKLSEKGTFTYKDGIISIKGNPVLTRSFKVVSLTCDLAKVKQIRNGKPMSGHYRWEKVN